MASGVTPSQVATHLLVEVDLLLQVVLHHALEVRHPALLEVVHLGQCGVGDDVRPSLGRRHLQVLQPPSLFLDLLGRCLQGKMSPGYNLESITAMSAMLLEKSILCVYKSTITTAISMFLEDSFMISHTVCGCVYFLLFICHLVSIYLFVITIMMSTQQIYVIFIHSTYKECFTYLLCHG